MEKRDVKTLTSEEWDVFNVIQIPIRLLYGYVDYVIILRWVDLLSVSNLKGMERM